MSEFTEDVIICRCEETTIEEILGAIRDGCRTLDEIKRMTRAGMGICQGRTCGALLAQILMQECDLPERAIAPLTARFPAKPLKVRSLSLQRERRRTLRRPDEEVM